MPFATGRTALELRSLITPSGALEASLAEVTIATPSPDEVVVRLEAALVTARVRSIA